MRRSTCCLILAMLASPAWASSPRTDAFAVKARLAATFLEQSSRLAIDRSDDPSLQALAAGELRSEPAFLAALNGQASDAPFAVSAVDGVQTGRSVASDEPLSAEDISDGGAATPAAAATLRTLATARGGAFDALFLAAQRAVLADLAATCRLYARSGDDPALRRSAWQEARIAGERIAALGRMVPPSSRD